MGSRYYMMYQTCLEEKIETPLSNFGESGTDLCSWVKMIPCKVTKPVNEMTF
jgi:hypothetical protein